MASPNNYAQQAKDLMERLEELRIEYEKFFIGVERKEPTMPRSVLERDIRRFLDSPKMMRNHEKLLVENLRSRFVSHSNYWQRTLREIENGTYHRHVIMNREREKLKQEMEAEKQRAKAKIANEVAAATAAGAKADAQAAAKAPAAAGGREYEGVFQQYKQAGASVDYAKLEALLKKQEAELRAKHGATKVDFSVKVVDGKPKLIAKPIK